MNAWDALQGKIGRTAYEVDVSEPGSDEPALTYKIYAASSEAAEREAIRRASDKDYRGSTEKNSKALRQPKRLLRKAMMPAGYRPGQLLRGLFASAVEGAKDNTPPPETQIELQILKRNASIALCIYLSLAPVCVAMVLIGASRTVIETSLLGVVNNYLVSGLLGGAVVCLLIARTFIDLKKIIRKAAENE